MTTASIRNDLKDIRYYYSRKKVFDGSCVGENQILNKIKVYTQAICDASPRLYDIYVSLYLGNHTQESLSKHFGYCIETISRLNSGLLKFFKGYFEENNITF